MQNNEKIILTIAKDIDSGYNVFGELTGKLHYHKFYELELVVDGEGEQLLNNKHFNLKKGDIYLVRPQDNHIIHSKNLAIRNLVVHEEVIPQYILKMLFTFKNPKQFSLKEEDFVYFESLLTKLHETVTKDTKENINITPIICENLLSSFLNLDQDSKNNTEKISGKVIFFIHENNRFTHKIKLDEIAKKLGYSKFYISSMFHKETGTSLQDYIILLRIEYAKKLLINTSLTIDEIIQSCGFTTNSNFYKKFFDITKKTPSKYRKSVI